MSHDTAMALLPMFAIGAVLLGIVLGYLLGCEGTLLSQRMAAAAIKRANRARRVARQERAAAAQAQSQRDDALRQLAAAEAVISETTHAVQRAGQVPDLEPPAGRHHVGGAR
ncbi:hypothetical protein ACOQFV_27485 [Nocardiopsis changdeensis]|uniref:Uncharacterized protein n=1 Tax=Nocardiopsis changdeensis TaxID=2831969 RepID=A0ABX8BP24_9ACTN|nr:MULTISPECIES: hypothetical protein [Nocardiopsis]QUX23009.1 hypothetical protein KGD84_00940 [Nocardiopsis changdeensis]QYX38954.1 hypothetical protein K1J57_10395 [Nocardiopsis sp. MT53]